MLGQAHRKSAFHMLMMNLAIICPVFLPRCSMMFNQDSHPLAQDKHAAALGSQ